MKLYLTANVSLLDNVLLAQKEPWFDREGQQFCEPNLCVLEKWNLQTHNHSISYCNIAGTQWKYKLDAESRKLHSLEGCEDPELLAFEYSEDATRAPK